MFNGEFTFATLRALAFGSAWLDLQQTFSTKARQFIRTVNKFEITFSIYFLTFFS